MDDLETLRAGQHDDKPPLIKCHAYPFGDPSTLVASTTATPTHLAKASIQIESHMFVFFVVTRRGF